MTKCYECVLETEGYRIKVTVFSKEISSVDRLARQKAIQLFRDHYGLRKNEGDLKITAIQEKSFSF